MNRIRKGSLLLLLCIFVTTVHAQVIFTYGNKPVTKEEFLKAFNKNNTEEKPTDKAYRDYLELYIRFKLRVQAALDMRLDTLPSQKAELNAFRSQVVESYLRDDESVNALVDEAIERSAKDVHIAHIFVAVSDSAKETEVQKARDKITAAWNQLKKGEPFEKVAQEYSEDPAVKENMGDIGYVTVFVLPYDLENIAYATPVGKFSEPYRSRKGFHIFKKIGERDAAGKIRVAQILLAFSPDASDADKQKTKHTADSLYRALQEGADFKALAQQFSGDNISFSTGGEMPAFGVGQYDPAFEKAAFALEKDGDISQPVLTAFGYHIIKRLQRIPVKTDKQDAVLREEMKQMVQSDKRMEVSKKALAKKIFQLTKFKKHSVNQDRFRAWSDSIALKKEPPQWKGFTPEMPLFTFAGETVRLKDWQHFLETAREFGAIQGLHQVPALYEEFMNTKALDHYKENLEKYNKEFAHQLNEFREGNLLFEIMQRNIWDAAVADTAGLRKYYEEHKNDYWWEPSADVILVTAMDAKMVEEAKQQLKSDHKKWRQYMEQSGGRLQCDSGRFELSQIPVRERTNFTEGLITSEVKNDIDNSFTFAYIINVYREREPRGFEDARGFVINDYQTALENKWIAELKEKYPVKINEAVVNSLPK
jgi:Parvulin-like peptidyl-prolyl isomerase